MALRLSVEDHERLKALADGMALSTYIRANALGEVLPRRRSRSTSSVVDQVAQLKTRPDLILAHLNDKKARFTRTDILRGLAVHISDPSELRIASDQALASPELTQL